MPWWTFGRLLRGVVISLPAIGLVACGLAAQGNGPGGVTGPTHGVSVEVGATTYAATETITVIVRNALGASIIATDHQTSCTIVQLQIETNGSWQNQGGCALGTATRQIVLEAESNTPVTVAPGAGQIKVKPWPAGSYRVAFTYRTGSVATPGPSETVYSQTFTVS
ncbi:MAG TPA: hypothetical protein VE338_13640 [Ktedonobacterales bacterium]|nr:hypothetical protein [Ktedonobacterales bacterium]